MSVLRFGLLGPLDVTRDGQRVVLTSGKLRIVLAGLLVRVNQTVSVDELVEWLWGDDAPFTARKTVQVYVMRLRQALDDRVRTRPLVRTRPKGYVIELESPHQLDLSRFHQLREESTVAAESGDLIAESARLTEALALWRGRALADVSSESLQREVVPRLEEVRLQVTERRLQVGLELGRHREIIGDLVQLTGDHPWREQFWIQLIVALQRSDRLADALDTCRTVLQLFRDEVGIDPGGQFQQLHRELLAGSATSAAADVVELTGPAELTPSAGPIRQLPPPVRRFFGRTELVWELVGRLSTAPEAEAMPAVNVSGPPGVGKTELALQVAHRLRADFPDGQLYVNLRGHAQGPPLAANVVLSRFLRALGVPMAHIPSELEDQAALYRSVLAGRRVLVLLDDAGYPDQVRPLLPGGPGCVVLVTSRSDLRGLAATQGVDHVQLAPLSVEESAEVVADLIGTKRASAEPEAVAALASTCGYLPLALRIAGANLAADPHVSIAKYERELREGTFAKLAIVGDERTGVRVAFDLSYKQLSSADRRLFRLLGLVFGPDFTAPAVAALADISVPDTVRSLDRLVAVNLVYRHAPGRYQLHDLIREYAADRARTEDGGDHTNAALDRMFDFYAHTADCATRRLYPGVPRLPLATPLCPQHIVALDTDPAAWRWLDAERHNLFAAVIRVADSPARQDRSWQLVDVLRGYVQSRGHAIEAMAACEAALRAAERSGDYRAQASVLDIHGLISYNSSCYRQAIDFHSKALAQVRQAQDLDAEAHCLHNLGRARTQLGQPKLAERCHAEALAISRKTGNREAEALALHYIGVAQMSFGNPRGAIEWHRQALTVSRQIGHRRTSYRALNGLGVASWGLGLLDDAAKYQDEVLGYCREMGLGVGEAVSLVCLAEISCDAGRFDLAENQAREAIDRSLEIGERRTEAGGLEIIATVRCRQGRYRAAIDGYTDALRLAQSISFAYGQVSTLLGLARAHRSLGDAALAAALSQRVLTTLRGSGMGILHAPALTELAHDHLELGELDRAASLANRAVGISRRRGQRLVEARALHVLGLVRHKADGADHALPVWQTALEVFTELGTPEAREISSLMQRIGT